MGNNDKKTSKATNGTFSEPRFYNLFPVKGIMSYRQMISSLSTLVSKELVLSLAEHF